MTVTTLDMTNHTLLGSSGPDLPSTTTKAAALPPPPSSGVRGNLVGYLLAGSDGSPSVGRADVIYLAVRGSGTVLYTIPRSLYLPNPCTKSRSERLCSPWMPGVARDPACSPSDCRSSPEWT